LIRVESDLGNWRKKI